MSNVRRFLEAFLSWRPRTLVRSVFALAAMTAISTTSVNGQATYSNIPAVLPGNVVSQGFECCQVAGIGDIVQMTSAATISSWDVGFSVWSLCSSYVVACAASSAGFHVPITLTAYDGTGGVLGSQLYQTTVNQFFSWRPETGGCTDATAWLAADGGCYHGQLQVVSFSGLNWDLPQDVAFQISFNSETWGYDPTGVSGPYNSLNVALTQDGASTGTDLNDWLAADLGCCSGLAGNSNVLGSQPDYGYSVMTQLDGTPASVTPEPATMSLMAMGLAGMAGAGIRRKRKHQ